MTLTPAGGLVWSSLLVLGGCRASDPGQGAPPSDSAPVAVVPAPMHAASAVPTACVHYLVDLACWLRSAGNPPSEVARAVAAARARVDSQATSDAAHDAVAYCERTEALKKTTFVAAGCSGAPGGLGTLPPPADVRCASDEHFFVLASGRVAGCHRDCTTTTDCPAGQACTSTGSAAEGPADEHFCQ